MNPVHLMLRTVLLAAVLCGLAAAQPAAPLPAEDDYYKLITLPVPEGTVLEIGGMAMLPSGQLAVATRRGDIWIIDNPGMAGNRPPAYRKFASGMHEVLGLAWHNGTLYCAQRGELTRLHDENSDGTADYYETVYAWPLSGHYHEYSYGPVVAPDGSMFVTGNVAFGDREWWRGESRVPWRGWALRITPDGQMEPWATGMRSPCGIGIVDGQFFYGDNQGDWIGSGSIVHVEKGDFTGHPAGLRWAGLPGSPVKLSSEALYAKADPRFSPPDGLAIKPENIEQERGTPLFELEQDFPSIKTPAVWLPHSVLGISTSEIITDRTGGAFGPFEGQLFVGDQGQSKIDRVFLEKVNGQYQGAAFAFREGFQSGVLRMAWGQDGSLFAGQTNRGWGSTGKEAYGLQQLVWTGKTPFEMKAVRAMPDGFEIEFTLPVDKASVLQGPGYSIRSFIYKYHPVYGSPIIHEQNCPVRGVSLSEDGLRLRVAVDSLRARYIHEIRLDSVRSYDGQLPLLHPAAYYTLNSIPEGTGLSSPQPLIYPKPAEEMPEEAAAPAMPHHPASHTMESGKPAPAAAPKPAPLAKRTTKMPADWGKPDRTISLGTRPGLKYDQTLITVKAGAKVKWTFSNNDDMPHNCVIVAPGAADAVGDQAIKLGIKGEQQSYVPASSRVLFHTRLIGPGATESIYFAAPSAPGDYTYVCTVPGHAALMRGTLRVVK
ncbi:MAG: plastocyanin/azurin family copper-binding protein [Bacteroidia bacterium]|nr:plastocyanin/azurin family copper-binding protein [Bacteroidia bacterium]